MWSMMSDRGAKGGQRSNHGVVRLPVPSPGEIKAARKAAGLTQQGAATLVSRSTAKAYRAWQGYEADVASSAHREIPAAVWELFMLLTDQHPAARLAPRRVQTARGEET